MCAAVYTGGRPHERVPLGSPTEGREKRGSGWRWAHAIRRGRGSIGTGPGNGNGNGIGIGIGNGTVHEFVGSLVAGAVASIGLVRCPRWCPERPTYPGHWERTHPMRTHGSGASTGIAACTRGTSGARSVHRSRHHQTTRARGGLGAALEARRCCGWVPYSEGGVLLLLLLLRLLGDIPRCSCSGPCCGPFLCSWSWSCPCPWSWSYSWPCY